MDEKMVDVLLDQLKTMNTKIDSLQTSLQNHQITSNERHLNLQNKVIIICVVLGSITGGVTNIASKLLGF